MKNEEMKRTDLCDEKVKKRQVVDPSFGRRVKQNKKYKILYKPLLKKRGKKLGLKFEVVVLQGRVERRRDEVFFSFNVPTNSCASHYSIRATSLLSLDGSHMPHTTICFLFKQNGHPTFFYFSYLRFSSC